MQKDFDFFIIFSYNCKQDLKEDNYVQATYSGALLIGLLILHFSLKKS